MSRVFEGFNAVGPPCPVCGTKANTKTVLVPIPGTEKDDLVECQQVHLECWILQKKMEMEIQGC